MKNTWSVCTVYRKIAEELNENAYSVKYIHLAARCERMFIFINIRFGYGCNRSMFRRKYFYYSCEWLFAENSFPLLNR